MTGCILLLVTYCKYSDIVSNHSFILWFYSSFGVLSLRNMNPYRVEEYMPYEYWSDEIKGPRMVRRLSTILKREGFPVLYKDDETKEVGCLWHRHFYTSFMEEEKKKAEEGWYEHKYTKEQLEMLATGLDTFVEEINQKQDSKRPGDAHLVAILSGYSKDIRKKM